MKRNIFLIILVVFWSVIILKSIFVNVDRNNNLEEGKYIFGIGIIKDYTHGSRVSPWFTYEIKYKDEIFIADLAIKGKLRAAKNDELRKYIGKKYFVKFSIEKPKYSELYIDKPVPEDFIYKEGQTWSKIPVDYE